MPTMPTEELLPKSVFVHLPEKGLPGFSTGEVKLEVAVGDIVMPGACVGVFTETTPLLSGRGLAIVSPKIVYHGCYEARVEQILPGSQPYEPILRLKPLRLAANYLRAEVDGEWLCEIPNFADYIHKVFCHEDLIIEPGQVVGTIKALPDLPDEDDHQIVYKGDRAKVLHVFHGNAGFVSVDDPLILYQKINK